MRKGILTELMELSDRLDIYRHGRILSMAMERKEAADKLESWGPELICHILKRTLTDGSKHTYSSHWDDEINGMLNKIARITLKPNNKKIPFKMAKNNILRPFFENGEDLKTEMQGLLIQERLTKDLLKPYKAKKAHKSINTLLETIFKEIEKQKYKPNDWINKYSAIVDTLEIV